MLTMLNNNFSLLKKGFEVLDGTSFNEFIVKFDKPIQQVPAGISEVQYYRWF